MLNACAQRDYRLEGHPWWPLSMEYSWWTLVIYSLLTGAFSSVKHNILWINSLWYIHVTSPITIITNSLFSADIIHLIVFSLHVACVN